MNKFKYCIEYLQSISYDDLVNISFDFYEDDSNFNNKGIHFAVDVKDISRIYTDENNISIYMTNKVFPFFDITSVKTGRFVYNTNTKKGIEAKIDNLYAYINKYRRDKIINDLI